MFLLLSSLTVLASISPNSQLTAKSDYQINSEISNHAFQPAYTSKYLTGFSKNTAIFHSYATTVGGGSFFVQNISCTYETCYSNYNPYNKDIYTVAAGIGELLMINSSNEIQQKINRHRQSLHKNEKLQCFWKNLSNIWRYTLAERHDLIFLN